MSIFQLLYIRKINKLHFFTYQIITFVFPTLNARKLANNTSNTRPSKLLLGLVAWANVMTLDIHLQILITLIPIRYNAV